MPRVSRRIIRTKARHDYGEEHLLALQTGHDYFHAFPTPEDRRTAWEDLRDEIMGEWIQKHPGTRPWGWWQFEAPEPRRRVDGKPHPFKNPERETKVAAWREVCPEVAAREAHKLFYGKPAVLIVPDDFAAAYEDELAYLRRLKLLTADERRRAEVATC